MKHSHCYIIFVYDFDGNKKKRVVKIRFYKKYVTINGTIAM